MTGVFNDLVRVASGSAGQGLFIFQTNDTKATVEGSHYFDFGVNVLQVGSLIIVAGDLDGTVYTAQYTVNSNDGTHVGVIEAANTPFPGVIMSFTSVSTKASDAAVVRRPAPFNGSVVSIYSVANGALATGDATLTAKIGATAVTTGVITITQSGSAAGDVDSCTPSALKTFSAGDLLSITGGGASTAIATADVVMVLLPS